MLELLTPLALGSPGVEVSPTVVTLGDPAREILLEVSNRTTVGVVVTPRIVDLDTRGCAFGPATEAQPHSAVAWIRTASAAWIAPGGTVPLPVRIDPGDDDTGGYGALLVLDVATADTPRGAPSKPWGHVGVPVIVRLPGEDPRLELGAPEVDGPTASAPLQVWADVRNASGQWARASLGAVVWAPGDTLRTRIGTGPATWIAPEGSCRLRSAPSAWLESGGFEIEARVDGAEPRRVPLVVP